MPLYMNTAGMARAVMDRYPAAPATASSGQFSQPRICQRRVRAPTVKKTLRRSIQLRRVPTVCRVFVLSPAPVSWAI